MVTKLRNVFVIDHWRFLVESTGPSYTTGKLHTVMEPPPTSFVDKSLMVFSTYSNPITNPKQLEPWLIWPRHGLPELRGPIMTRVKSLGHMEAKTMLNWPSGYESGTSILYMCANVFPQLFPVYTWHHRSKNVQITNLSAAHYNVPFELWQFMSTCHVYPNLWAHWHN